MNNKNYRLKTVINKKEIAKRSAVHLEISFWWETDALYLVRFHLKLEKAKGIILL